MEPSHRARWRSALLLLPLVAAAAVDGQAPTTLQARYERIIAPGETPKKLTDGFTFTEGPTWLKGKLYFSDMWFKNPAAGDWAAARRAAG